MAIFPDWYADGRRVNTCSQDVCLCRDEDDARLIAAAPDMYYMLRAFSDSGKLHPDTKAKIDIILMKADGGL